MLIPKTQDTIHKARLYRLLMALADDPTLMSVLRFKGGTCAAMAGWLDRFSVDLDFDYVGAVEPAVVEALRQQVITIAHAQGLAVKDYSQRGLQWFFKYEAALGTRNTLKVEAQFPPPATNQYAPLYLPDIDRTLLCQTKETMFSNKLVAVLDRWERHASIAARDLFDIYQFFLQGFSYDTSIIEERRGANTVDYFKQLIAFIDKHVTPTVIAEDLNPLLTDAVFQTLRPILKTQILFFLRAEVAKLK